MTVMTMKMMLLLLLGGDGDNDGNNDVDGDDVDGREASPIKGAARKKRSSDAPRHFFAAICPLPATLCQ